MHPIFVGSPPGIMQIGRLLRGRPQALDGEELLYEEKSSSSTVSNILGKLLEEVRKRCWNLMIWISKEGQ